MISNIRGDQGIVPSPIPLHVPTTPKSVTESVELGEIAHQLICTRQNVSPKRLTDPAPAPNEWRAMLESAAAAPDHGLLQPWRFVLVPAEKRADLAEVFALCLIDRDPGATLEQIEAAREKAFRAPLLFLVVAKLGAVDADIPEIERMVSVGAAVQNLLLCAHGMGYGSSLTSGQALHTQRMAGFFGLQNGEKAVCFVNMGTVTQRRKLRVRPAPETFVSELG